MFSRLVIKNLNQFKRHLNQRNRDRIKAGHTAVKVEAFRVKKDLAREIRYGAPGGRRFEPLTQISIKLQNARKGKKPISKLAQGVRYNTRKMGDSLHASVGFIEPGMGTRSATPKGLMWLAEIHQEGFRRPVTERMAEFMATIGGQGRRTKRSRWRSALFLRKETRTLETPAREIIEPYWRAHKREILRNIRTNYQRKLRGERI